MTSACVQWNLICPGVDVFETYASDENPPKHRFTFSKDGLAVGFSVNLPAPPPCTYFGGFWKDLRTIQVRPYYDRYYEEVEAGIRQCLVMLTNALAEEAASFDD